MDNSVLRHASNFSWGIFDQIIVWNNQVEVTPAVVISDQDSGFCEAITATLTVFVSIKCQGFERTLGADQRNPALNGNRYARVHVT